MRGYSNKGVSQINTISFYRLRCSECSEFVRYKDRVFLDELNMITHQRCRNIRSWPTKDEGTFNDIINKYDFFADLKKK